VCERARIDEAMAAGRDDGRDDKLCKEIEATLQFVSPFTQPHTS